MSWNIWRGRNNLMLTCLVPVRTGFGFAGYILGLLAVLSLISRLSASRSSSLSVYEALDPSSDPSLLRSSFSWLGSISSVSDIVSISMSSFPSSSSFGCFRSDPVSSPDFLSRFPLLWWGFYVFVPKLIYLVAFCFRDVILFFPVVFWSSSVVVVAVVSTSL